MERDGERQAIGEGGGKGKRKGGAEIKIKKKQRDYYHSAQMQDLESSIKVWFAVSDDRVEARV